MKFLVTDIEFDFSDSQGELDEWEQEQIVKNNLGVWEADNDCLLYTSDAADE